MRLKRMISLVIALILSTSMSVINVFAESASGEEAEIAVKEVAEEPTDIIYDTENEIIAGISPEWGQATETSPEELSGGTEEGIASISVSGETIVFDADGKFTVSLPEAGDTKTYNMQVDHSLYPDARLCIFPYGGTGECTVNVSGIGSRTIRTKPASEYPYFDLKVIFELNGSEEVKDYTVTVSTKEGNAGCALILATKDTLAGACGGRGNAALIQKNQSTEYGVSYFSGFRQLLAGEGEWFRYTADGDTYICAAGAAMDDLVVAVFDTDVTGSPLQQTEPKDIEIVQEGNGKWTGYVSKKFALQPGRDYYIRVRSASAEINSDYAYLLSVGLPRTVKEMIEVSSNNTYSIPANTSKTFSFKVSGYPNSTRLSNYGRICFQTGSVVDNLDITSLKITAPNGKVLVAPSQGRYDLSKPIDYNNYLTSKDNIPLNGTWTVTIKSSAALSGLKFTMKCNIEHIPGSDGNE